MNTVPEMRPLIFGEVLFDHFPDGSRVLGGAPFNVAWHLQAFGLAPLFISRVGTDAEGEEIRAAMQAWGMDSGGLQTDTEHATGSVEVSISGGEPHYDIVYPRAYDFINADGLPDLPAHGILYHGSLALRHAVSAQALAEIRRRTSVPRFVDINLRAPWWDAQGLQQMLDGARWVKLNSDELALVAPEAGDEEARLQYLLTDDRDFVVLTRGSEGASVIGTGSRHDVQPSSGLDVVDVVGAGDAFCSVLLAGMIRQWPLPVTLARAQQFASAVVGIRGATSRDRGFYQRFIDTWRD
jgi:fructokinase